MMEAQGRAGIERPFTVSEINRVIRGLVEPSLRSVWISGELADITLHASSHVYFTLKDSQCQLRGVAFRYAETARRLQLARGMAVDIHGAISVYEPRGECQVVASRILPKGTGELNRQLEELKARLAAEGLFDAARKRAIPAFPKIIGLVTAATGAAKQDFLKNLACPIGGKHVRFIPSQVQGGDAPRQMTAAIRYFNETAGCDVIVLTRGGGGIEDLSAFNDETLVRAVASSGIPVVSAVGHDRDLSLCDYAADCSVSTPTAAANLMVRGTLDLCARLEDSMRRMNQTVQTRLYYTRQRYDRLSSCRYLTHPEEWLGRLAQRLDYGTSRLMAALPNLAMRNRGRLDAAAGRLMALSMQMTVGKRGRLALAQSRLEGLSAVLVGRHRQRLEACGGLLRALNPRNVMTRGYSILLDGGGHAVRDARQVAVGDGLRAVLASGELSVAVRHIVPAEVNEDANNRRSEAT